MLVGEGLTVIGKVTKQLPGFVVYVILTVPDRTPVTTPDTPPTVATSVLLLVNVPPPVPINVVVNPVHTVDAPIVAPGVGLTVIAVVVKQPVGITYEIVTVPAVTPVTAPVVEFTVALALLLLQAPPPVELASVVVEPTQTLFEPVLAEGVAFTVKAKVAKQAPVVVYVITTGPAETPATSPVPLLTVAMAVLLLVQVPPATPFVNCKLEPTQTAVTAKGYEINTLPAPA
jgi:hypothetical protein